MKRKKRKNMAPTAQHSTKIKRKHSLNDDDDEYTAQRRRKRKTLYFYMDFYLINDHKRASKVKEGQQRQFCRGNTLTSTGKVRKKGVPSFLCPFFSFQKSS